MAHCCFARCATVDYQMEDTERGTRADSEADVKASPLSESTKRRTFFSRSAAR